MEMKDFLLKPTTRNWIKSKFTKDKSWLASYNTWRIVSSTNGSTGLQISIQNEDYVTRLAVFFIESGVGERQIVAFDYLKGEYADIDIMKVINFDSLCKGFLSGYKHHTLNRMILENNRKANFDMFVEFFNGAEFKGF